MKIIHVLPHNIEDFMAGNYHDFDHHSIRFMEKIKNFSRQAGLDFEQELWILSQKGISAQVIHKKGFKIRLFPLSLKLSFPLEISFSLLKKMTKTREKNVVWHLQSYHLLMNSLFFPLLLKIKEQKFISHFHGGGPSFHGFKSAFYTLCQYLINLRISLNLANKVIVLNHNEEKRVNKFLRVKKTKIFYFPNTISLVQSSEDKLRKIEGEDQRFKMVYAGRMEKINQDFLLILEKILAENKNCLLEIIGLKEKDSRLESLKKKFPRQIILSGWLKKEKLLEKFQKANIFVHLYAGQEGSPITIIEALSQGLPVLSLNQEGTRDVVKNNYNGWLVKNLKEYEGKLKKIIENPEKTKKIKNNCLSSIKENFTDEKYFPRLIQIYRHLINS